MISLEGLHDELNMDEINLERDGTYPRHGLVEPSRSVGKDEAEEKDASDGERNVEHALGVERELAVMHLLEPYARTERNDEEKQDEPKRLPADGILTAYGLAYVYAKEEDGHTAPENLNVSYGIMNRSNVLNHDRPHEH